MEKELITEVSKLLEKTGLDELVPVGLASAGNVDQSLSNAIIQLKSLNARYEKDEALVQVQWLMRNYNIQIDELMERIGS